jgi:hypothetical protein
MNYKILLVGAVLSGAVFSMDSSTSKQKKDFDWEGSECQILWCQKGSRSKDPYYDCAARCLGKSVDASYLKLTYFPEKLGWLYPHTLNGSDCHTVGHSRVNIPNKSLKRRKQ